MYCKCCHRPFVGITCPICGADPESPDARSSSPTLIRGGYSGPPTLHSRPQRDGGRSVAPLICMGLVLGVVPWMLTDRQNTPPPIYVNAPVPSVGPPPPSHPALSHEKRDGNIHLILHLRGSRWVDTGIDMCGCTHVKIRALGEWQTPVGLMVEPGGQALSYTGPSPRSMSGWTTVDKVGTGGHALALGTEVDSEIARDRLTQSAPSASLIARVGASPFAPIGRARQLTGDQFSDDGTLKIGMNAGKRLPPYPGVKGTLTVEITGDGAITHSPRECPTPK